MKLQRLQRLQPLRGKSETARVPQFNQTIIINNPNININYLPSEQPLSTRGLENWHLNNNLKEFGQTRQLGFFKQKRHERNKSNSPYVIHKVRTQDLKNVAKVYAGTNLKDTLGNFRKNETLAHLPREQEKVQPDPPAVLQRIQARQDKTNERFYPHKKNQRSELHKNFETLPTNFLATHLPNPEHIPKTFRKNRFEVAGENITALTDRPPLSREDEPREGQGVEQREQEQEAGSAEGRSGARGVPFELRRRAFNRTIESINRGLLHHTDSYLDRTFLDQVPQAQIELCVNSLPQPEHARNQHDRSSQRCFDQWPEYDFHFDEERRRRPKTPKRKKPYDSNQ